MPKAVGFSDLLPQFLVGVVVRIAEPILVELVFRKNDFLRRVFLGQS